MGSQCDAAVSTLPLLHTHTHAQAQRSTCKLLATCGLRPQGSWGRLSTAPAILLQPPALELSFAPQSRTCGPLSAMCKYLTPATTSTALVCALSRRGHAGSQSTRIAPGVISCLSTLVSWWHAITGIYQICAVQPGQPTLCCIASKVEASTSQSKSSDSRCQEHHDDVG